MSAARPAARLAGIVMRRHLLPPAVGAAALVGFLALSGCASSSSPGTGPQTTGGPVTDPQAALDQQATALRALVDGLVEQAAAPDWRLTADGDGPCGLPAGDSRWPRQWHYGKRSFEISDAPGRADDIVSTLTAEGWSARQVPAEPGQTTRTLQRDGTVISVSTATTPNVLDLNAYSACVTDDGQLDTSPVT